MTVSPWVAGVVGWALAALSHLPQDSRSQRPVADILQALAGQTFATRRDAVWACRGRSEPEILDALRRVARNDSHVNVRAFALEVLGDARPPVPLAFLQEVLDREPARFPREAALLAVGKTKDPRAYDLLLPLLQVRQDAGAAARALGALGDSRAFDGMATLLATWPADPAIRDLVPAALLALDRERGIDALLARFSGELASTLAACLATQPQPRVRAAMVQHLDKGPHELRLAALRVLEGVADVTCLDALLRCLDREPKLRTGCALALARTRLAPAARPLCERLASEDEAPVRRAVAQALRSLRDPGIVPDLLKALARESDDAARAEILAALGSQGERCAVATLVALMDDDTVTSQPARFSRILPFPFNLRVGDVAVWAVATLVDGQEPFPLATLSAFPTPPPRAACDAVRTRLAAWWLGLKDRAAFTLAPAHTDAGR